MKRTLLTLWLLAASAGVIAQQPDFTDPSTRIPVDPEVRMGRLENGLTYYVRHNDKPKGQADFYILHDVGAIQEEDSQQGLAHFLEHMAFNGTKNLPDKTLTEYLEKIGVKFGANLNAATGWDQTVYNIANVPTLREGIIDSCLLILHDWSHFIALEPEEIDAERGVIMEELRTRDNAAWRSSFEMIKTLGRGTRYEHRNLIGYLDDLKSFDHDRLEAFYHRWYRPDYQAVVVVGDIDADAVESKIKALMADIPAPAPGAPEKERITIPGNEAPVVSIYTDPEMQRSRIQLFIKHRMPPREENDRVGAAIRSIIEYYTTAMENARLQEIAMRPDAPFLAAGMSTGSIGLMPTLDAVAFTAVTRDGELAPGFGALLTEMERMRRHGFTQSEFDRTRENLLRGCRRAYEGRNDRQNGEFVQACLAHFQHNRMMPDAETEWRMDSTLIHRITLAEVNAYAARRITKENQAIVVSAPEKSGTPVPSSEELLALRDSVSKAAIGAYEDRTVDEPLIPEETPLPGSTVGKTAHNAAYGTTEWQLANGARIIVKPTEFKADEIRMTALCDGGLSLLTDEEYETGQLLESVVGFSGLGRFPATDLQKLLTGKVVSAGISVGEYSNGVDGYCSPQDLETMLQLVYLDFMQPRFDERDFRTLMTMLESRLENTLSDPDYVFQTRLMRLIYGDHPRRQPLSPETLERMDFTKLSGIHRKLYPGARGFTFIFVGNIDPEILRPLAEKYIGSIPDQRETPKYADDGVRPVRGIHPEVFRTAMRQPKVSVSRYFSGKIDFSLRNMLAMNFLTQALNERYRLSIREEKGGTYGVSCSGDLSRIPYEGYSLQISFDTNEEMADELRETVMREFRELAEEGPEAGTVEKTREYLRKTWKSGLELNGSWIAFISNLEREGIDYLADYERELETVTPDDVRRLAKKILADGNSVELVMRPEAGAEPAPSKQ